MKTKQDLIKRIDEINIEINKLRDEGLKIGGKIDLLYEQELESKKETPKE